MFLRLLFTLLKFILCAEATYTQASDIQVKVLETPAPKSAKLDYDFYSESYSTTYFNGFVNQSRLRLLYPLYNKTINPYFGVNTSHDFTGSKTLRFADNFASPTTGVLIKPWNFLGLFAEYRRLYRTQDNELPREENDSRYGAYFYFFEPVFGNSGLHLETYGEAVALSRFTSSPVSTVWLKAGKSFSLFSPSLSMTPYLEAFYRESPSLLIGIDERSLRFGTQLKWQNTSWSAKFLGYRRFASNTVPEGWEAFLVLSANGGLL